MGLISVVIDTPHNPTHYALPGQGVQNLVRVAALLNALIGGVYGSAVIHTSVATATATLVSVVAANTITIGGVTLTASASPANESQFAVGANDTECAASLAAVINAHSTLKFLVSASASAGVVTITAAVPGPVGNFIPVVRVGAPITLSAAVLSGASVTPERVR